MPKISHTILMAIAATAAVLAIAACGGSSNKSKWSASDVSQLKAKFNSEISQTKSELPKADQAKFQTAANSFLDCTLNVVEPVATPAQALSNNWQPSKAVQTKITNTCEKPFEKSVQSLVPSS